MNQMRLCKIAKIHNEYALKEIFRVFCTKAKRAYSFSEVLCK